MVEAVAEFPFIDPTFLPLAQQPTSTPDITPTQKPVHGIIIRGLAPTAADEGEHQCETEDGEKSEGSQRNRPRVVLKIGGERVAVLDPGIRQRRDAEMEDAEEVAGAEDDGAEDSNDDEAGPSTADRGGHDPALGDAFFCPAPHRATLLQKFTRHFVRHPIFPVRLGHCQTAEQIREASVKDMYFHKSMEVVGAIGITPPVSIANDDDGRESLVPAQAPIPSFHPPSKPRPRDIGSAAARA